MKKSAIYYVAQRAVVTDQSLAVDVRLEVLRELMSAENLERILEEKQEKANETV